VLTIPLSIDIPIVPFGAFFLWCSFCGGHQTQATKQQQQQQETAASTPTTTATNSSSSSRKSHQEQQDEDEVYGSKSVFQHCCGAASVYFGGWYCVSHAPLWGNGPCCYG